MRPSLKDTAIKYGLSLSQCYMLLKYLKQQRIENIEVRVKTAQDVASGKGHVWVDDKNHYHLTIGKYALSKYVPTI